MDTKTNTLVQPELGGMEGLFNESPEYKVVHELIESVQEELEKQFNLYGLVSKFMFVLKYFRKIDNRLKCPPKRGEDGFDLYRLVYADLKSVGLAIQFGLKQTNKDCKEDLEKFTGYSYKAFVSCIEELEADEQAFLTGHTEETAAVAAKRLFG